MKTKFLSILVAVFALGILFPSFSFADLTNTTIYELNNATPGTAKAQGNNSDTGLGTILRGYFESSLYAGANFTGIGNVDSNSPSTTVSGQKLVVWQVPLTLNSISLGNGVAGQELTIIKGNTGTTAGKISPTTKTGYTDITLTNQGEGVTLEYINDTIGWIPKGFFGGSTSVVPKVNP